MEEDTAHCSLAGVGGVSTVLVQQQPLHSRVEVDKEPWEEKFLIRIYQQIEGFWNFIFNGSWVQREEEFEKFFYEKLQTFIWIALNFIIILCGRERAKIWNYIKYVNFAGDSWHHMMTPAIIDLYLNPVHRVCNQVLWVLTKARFLLMITYKLQMNRNPSHLADALMFAISRYLLLIVVFLQTSQNLINSLLYKHDHMTWWCI